ncbi:sulfatase-like hydrolase/transferase [Rhodobacteraceae bacterium F11138]|nr:sulfatase-like hydrolase/transferase [Rhodobacteraceae bacterium F11138]
MTNPKNILFIMCDQLRFDYLGCAGHPTIRTPNIDALAAKGVRFDRAYVQSPICGPSRMSFYTGRYVISHGSTWNNAPLRVGEWNIGDHLNPLGMRTLLCGKTHMKADVEGMKRLGIAPDSVIGAKLSQCGFEVWDRLDGVHPEGGKKQPTHYNDYLNSNGYEGEYPVAHWVNAVESEEGAELSGWLMSNSGRPARVNKEDSETAYTARRAREFIENADDDAWCLHLSFIKPHWPYVAPSPYNTMYSVKDVVPAVRSAAEKIDPHPVFGAFHQHRVCQNFSRNEVRETVIPTYMGLISQIDDEIGDLMSWMETTGRAKDTLIVFTSDHGDYLGDHWLGEKELFHDPSVRIPLIVVDPSTKADATRGTVSNHLVEAIDLLPTFVEIAGGKTPSHILEGHSLLPLLHDPNAGPLRNVAFSEYDYSCRLARNLLGRDIPDCRLQMAFDGRWKLIRAEGFRPILFDLETDPHELTDLGDDPRYSAEINRLNDALLSWSTAFHNRITRSDADIEAYTGSEFHNGVLIGFWDEQELQRAKEQGYGGN